VSLEQALQMKRLEQEVENHQHHLEDMVKQRTKQLQSALRRIEQTYDDTLEALAAALDLRDNDTAGHSLRVTGYCLEMSKAIGCSGEQLKHIVRGAYLHDIGKIGIPDAILLKPGKLTPDERKLMESHARVGYELVSRIVFLAPAAEIVLTHQERYDGTGYPQGLVGEEIPLGARIFAVADTLDAMTTDRPYRRALPFEAARAEIIRESTRQFDPEVVRVFLSIPEKVWEDIRLKAAAPRKALSRPVPDAGSVDPEKSGPPTG
jgi:putative nucleotidyltransferase with HDIG domain